MEPLTWIIAAVCLLLGVVLGYVLALARSLTKARSAELETSALAATLSAERAGFTQRIEAERAGFTRQLAAVQGTQEQLSQQFGALAAQALSSNSQQFLHLAGQHLQATQAAGQADVEKRAAAIENMVVPLNNALGQLRTQLGQAEQARAATSAQLGEQLRTMTVESQALRTETAALVTALRNSGTRGAWGEAQLRRLVEVAGMVDRVDFTTQVHVSGELGALRPDMVVHQAGEKNIVVDSKVALIGYLDAYQATDEVHKASRLSAHAKHVRKHVEDLSGKAYWDQFTNSPEFVVMFLPAESFLSAALDQDPTILEFAFERNVVIATPTTLLALLKTVSFAWRQDSITQNAQEVLRVGKELHSRLATLSKHLGKVGGAIESATKAYNDVIGSYESRVLVSARRFKDLEVVSEELAALRPVETFSRRPLLLDEEDLGA